MLHPTPADIRHVVLAPPPEGMRQSVIAGRVGLTRATVNHILRGHVATGTWCKASPWGLHRRPHLVYTVLC